MTEKTFYVVWCPQSSIAKQESHLEAISEAKRLAGLHQGFEYHVLALIGTARKEDAVYSKSDFV